MNSDEANLYEQEGVLRSRAGVSNPTAYIELALLLSSQMWVPKNDALVMIENAVDE
jgi:hypothetical protein